MHEAQWGGISFSVCDSWTSWAIGGTHVIWLSGGYQIKAVAVCIAHSYSQGSWSGCGDGCPLDVLWFVSSHCAVGPLNSP